jgi:hypothetical protein
MLSRRYVAAEERASMKHEAHDPSLFSRLPANGSARPDRVLSDGRIRLPRAILAVAALALGLCTRTGLHAFSEVPGVQYLGPVEGAYPGTFAAWVYFNYPMSVDCSPPRACYAKSQWVYAHVNCFARSATALQIISMDLNGDVVAVANWNDPEQLEHQRFRRSNLVDARSRVLARLCGVYERDDERPDGHRNVERPRPVPRQPK